MNEAPITDSIYVDGLLLKVGAVGTYPVTLAAVLVAIAIGAFVFLQLADRRRRRRR